MYTRAEWGAAFSNGFGPAPVPWSYNIAHHTDTLSTQPEVDSTFEQDCAAVRELDRIGQSRFGGGISYTAVIPPSGRVFEGTGVNRQGAHTLGLNDRARAIVFVGNYDRRTLTQQQINSAGALLAYWYTQGWTPQLGFTWGHQEAPGNVGTTDCPGSNVLAAINTINKRAAEYATGQAEDDMALKDETVYRGSERGWGSAADTLTSAEAQATETNKKMDVVIELLTNFLVLQKITAFGQKEEWTLKQMFQNTQSAANRNTELLNEILTVVKDAKK